MSQDQPTAYKAADLHWDVINVASHGYVKAPFLLTVMMKVMYPVYEKWFNFLITKRKLSTTVAFAVTMTLCHAITYAVTVAFFELVEMMGWWEHYRVPRTSWQNPTRELRNKAIKEASASWFGMLFGGQILYKLFERIGMPQATVPMTSSFFTIWFQLCTATIFSNVTFYWIHRMLHLPYFYKRIHKVHHEFLGTVTPAAEYTHPVESLLNIIPAVSGCMVMRAHPYTWLAFMMWRVQEGLETHSGYHFRGSFLHRCLSLTNSYSTLYHDAHHVENKGEFGELLWDWVFGTSSHWLEVGGAEGYLRKRLAIKERGVHDR